MRILIDISAVVFGTGVSTYTTNLVSKLLEIDKSSEYLLFGGSLRSRDKLKKFISSLRSNNFKAKILPIPPTLADLIWNRLHILSIEKIAGKVDIFHSSDWTQPPSSAFKVTTIHDLIPLKFPELSSPKIISTHIARIKWVKREVDRIIVPSQAVAQDCLEFGFQKEKIRVIPEAPDPIFRPAKKYEIAKIKRKYRIFGDYLLSVGVGERKNTKRIIEAFEKVKVERDLKLVLVGETDIDEYRRLLHSRGVVFLGHVPKKDLPKLYSGAKVLVYPSLSEGFGLPILEAFSCRLCVVISNIQSLLETAKGAALVVDPYEPDSIADGIKSVLNNREKWVKRGLNVLKRYSWEKTAKSTLKVYKEAQ